MHHISQTLSHSGVGGRISSPHYRETLAQCDDFAGLEENTQRYDLLLLVKRAGKSMGFTPRMIELLDYYMAYTRDIDWEQGARPIIYQSLSRTALDLGVSERQIQKLEKALFNIGALTWHDSGNHRRYGQRDPQTGAILYAYGVDLTPLAYLKGALQDHLHQKKLYDDAWMETKRQISWYRRQIKACMAELYLAVEEGAKIDPPLYELERSYEHIAVQIRAHMDLARLQNLREEHKALYERASLILKEDQKTHIRPIDESKITQKGSFKSEQEFTHYKSTTQKQSNKLDTGPGRSSPKCFQKSSLGNSAGQQRRIGEGASSASDDQNENIILKAGLQHITLKQTLNAASERFRAYIPMRSRAMDWNDLVEAAYQVKSKELHIPQDFWAEACEVLGRSGAAICVLLTDQAALRLDNPVKSPPAYFKSMVNRAKSGELHLQNSIFAHLKRGEEGA